MRSTPANEVAALWTLMGEQPQQDLDIARSDLVITGAWREANLWLEESAKSCGSVVGLDSNEVDPGSVSDDEDAWDAIIGARLLYRLIATALATR